VNILQRSAQRFLASPRSHLQRAIMQHAALPAIAFDYAVSSRARRSRIDSQHTNPRSFFLHQVPGHRHKFTAIIALWPLLSRRFLRSVTYKFACKYR